MDQTVQENRRRRKHISSLLPKQNRTERGKRETKTKKRTETPETEPIFSQDLERNKKDSTKVISISKSRPSDPDQNSGAG